MSPTEPSADATEQQLRERYPLRAERFAHAGVQLELLLPAAPDALIDVSEFNRDERLPYWAELWPSARALARHLLERPAPAEPVLELGCGLALPSLVLLARGARVLATDYYAEALDFARVNARRNALPPLPTRLTDWREPAGLGQWDRVIVSDVLYERRNVDALAGVLRRALRPGGTALLADPGRSYLDEFRGRMQGHGWTVRPLAARDEPPTPGSAPVSRVQLLRLEAPAAAPTR